MSRQTLFPVIFSFTFLASALSPNLIRYLRSDADETYCNERFEFCVQVPNGYFTETILSDNGEDVTLIGKNGNVTLNISGEHNVESFSADELAAYLLGDAAQPEVTEAGFVLRTRKDGKFRHLDVRLFGDRYVVSELSGPSQYEFTMNNIARKLKVETRPALASVAYENTGQLD